MNIRENGVIGNSSMGFTVPSSFAKNALYYVPQFGHFYCDSRYRVSRSFLDLFLIMFVVSGTLHLRVDGKEYEAYENQIVLLDCRKPHEYFCSDSVEFMWLHFFGNNSCEYGDYLYNKTGMIFSGEHISNLKNEIAHIFYYAQSIPINEHDLSLRVHHMLCRLAAPEKSFNINHPLGPVIQHMREHFEENLTLDELASICSMSKSHFIRSFQRYFNRTPHNYLLMYRLQQAKLLLQTSTETIEQIAESCGFNSASHFARAFRADSGISPTEFREIQF